MSSFEWDKIRQQLFIPFHSVHDHTHHPNPCQWNGPGKERERVELQNIEISISHHIMQYNSVGEGGREWGWTVSKNNKPSGHWFMVLVHALDVSASKQQILYLDCWCSCQELVHYRPRTFIQELLAGDCWALPLLRMSTKWRKTGRHKTMDTDAGSLLPVMDLGECAVGRGLF